MFVASLDLILRCGHHVHLREEKERFVVPRMGCGRCPIVKGMGRLCIGPLQKVPSAASSDVKLAQYNLTASNVAVSVARRRAIASKGYSNIDCGGGTLHAGTPNQHSDTLISLSIRPNRCLLRQAPTCDPQRLLPCCCQIPRVAQPRLVSPTADQITRQLLGVTNIWTKFNQNRYKYGTNGLLS